MAEEASISEGWGHYTEGSSSRKTWLIVAENLDDCHIYKIVYSEQNVSPCCSRELL